MHNGWKVAGLSLIRVKQNQCSLEVAESYQISQFFYTVVRKVVAKFSHLGVVLDENLSWKDHVEYVSSKVSRRLGRFSCIWSCLTLETSKQVYTSLLQPLYDYADVAWGKSQRGVAKSYTVQLELYYGRTHQEKCINAF